MATIRKKDKKSVPSMATSSLSDIIFMLLFFFMMTTSMREETVLVQFTLPDATELQKLENKSLASFVYVGVPLPQYVGTFGNAPRIQLNDSFRSARDIGQFVASERDGLPERDRPLMMVNLKADRNAPMGIITDIKLELRKANLLRIIYAAVRGGE